MKPDKDKIKCVHEKLKIISKLQPYSLPYELLSYEDRRILDIENLFRQPGEKFCEI